MKIKGETADLIAIFDWIRLYPNISPFVFHLAGERLCSPQYGYLLKRMGCQAGMSDIFIAIPRGKYNGCFIELKYGKNKPTKLQLDFLSNMASQNYHAIWRTGFDECKKAIEEYLLNIV